MDEVRGNIALTLSEAKNRLITAGFDPDRVTTKLVTAVSSRAGGVVDEAREGGCGTIIVGRRGTSNVKEFFMDSVCNKVLHLATGMAVYVVA